MVRRDPRTGQFVSEGSGFDWNDTRRIDGFIRTAIPAADLNGGTETERISNDDTEIIPFDEVIDVDEVFHLAALQINASASIPTTSTAEAYMAVKWGISEDFGDFGATMSNHPFWQNTQWEGGPDGIIDGISVGLEASDLLAGGILEVTNSNRDTATGTAAGSDIGRYDDVINFREIYGAMPIYDNDDELSVPHEFEIDGVDDSGVTFHLRALAHGFVEELD